MTRSTNVIHYTKNPRNSKLSEKQLISRCQHQKWQRHQKHPTQDFLDKLGKNGNTESSGTERADTKRSRTDASDPRYRSYQWVASATEPQGSGGVSNMKIKHSLNRLQLLFCDRQDHSNSERRAQDKRTKATRKTGWPSWEGTEKDLGEHKQAL